MIQVISCPAATPTILERPLPHIRFYRFSQLRGMKVDVQHVSDLTRNLISEESIDKSVISRVKKGRAPVRIELIQFLAGLKHVLNVLFP